MAIQNSNLLTPREVQMQQYEKEMLEMQMKHAREMKLLEVEILKLEAKWQSWIKLPLVIVTLPVRILLVIPLSIYAATKQTIPEFYERFFK